MRSDLRSQLNRAVRSGLIAAGVIVLGGMPLQVTADEGSALPLPQWSPDELQMLEREGGPPGLGILLPPDTTLLPPIGESGFLHTGPKLADAPPSVFASPTGLRAQDMALFLPDSLLRANQSPSSGSSPTPATALRFVAPEVLTACYEAPGDQYLLDTQGLVPEIASEHIHRFLNFHAEDARIRAYVMVIDRDQKLPADAQLHRVASGSLAKTSSCLLVFPLGEPWRARLFLSQPVYAATTQTYLADMVSDCVKDAMLTNDAGEQLHRFAVRLSTRLFWLQKVMAQQATRQPAPLEEISPDVATAPPAAQASTSASGRGFMEIGWVVLLMVGALAAVGLGAKRLLDWHSHRDQRRIWILPEPDPLHRLGGTFSGGSGAAIAYQA